MDAIKALLKQIVDFWNGKEKRFKRNVIIIAGAVLAIVIILSVVLNQVDYAELYSGLDSEDSAAILVALDTENVTYKVEGSRIFVPAKDADRLRLSLSGEVKSGINLDILQQGQGLGMSESDKQVYRIAQREVNIKKSIETLTGVDKASVMLVVPEDSSLVISADKQYATAGIILTLEEGFEISDEEVNAIALFVEKSVPGLKLENISIMDSAMRNLNVSGTESDEEISTNEQQALTADVQKKLKEQVLDLLVPVFGFGRVTATVHAELNFDSKTTDSVTFTPVVGEEGIVRSIEKFREKIVNGSAAASGEPGTTTNTNGATTYPVVNADNGTYEKNTETINNEINEMKIHLEEAKGTVKNLSVAVVVDNTGMTEDYTSDVMDMVSKAVGVSTDYISVKFMPMAAVKAAQAGADVEDPAITLDKSRQMRFYIIVGAIVFVVLLAMVLVFMGRKPKALPQPESAAASEMMPGLEYATAEEREAADELATIELVKDSSAKEQIGRLIEKNPELVANLLRTWLSDEQE